ncbi:class I SAM-dependent methyltransferase [Ktedonosporobacter rubrisoli]|uniref:Class I SAM-dependent methyltransferase n=1 Tax=Ktedonosporobacter rubrisoli TaxID=2509675 RepID=A0A4P6K4R3_KTERU|nr:methyltransferase domain-containing protein [Ktedonosporobacter rubrisoli]QBD83239.1 class I SAM-dependent methyltransferase [Ktedonosporobacter rubrisoli]
MLEEIYTSGEFQQKNPTWHVEDSPWKAKQIMRMLEQRQIRLRTICEVGCGVGEILKQMQEQMSTECAFWGYEISPQAIELCRSRENAKLHFRLQDIRKEEGVYFDAILLIDVIEHLEDYLGFLRDIRPKSQYKIIHLPLELTVNMVLSGKLIKSRENYGHLHHFVKDTALQMVRDAGYEVLDYFYTHMANELPSDNARYEIKRKLLKLPRKLFYALNQDLAVRVLGGSNILILAQ